MEGSTLTSSSERTCETKDFTGGEKSGTRSSSSKMNQAEKIWILLDETDSRLDFVDALRVVRDGGVNRTPRGAREGCL